MPLNLHNLIEIDYIQGYFSRNKKIFTLSILIFLIFASMSTLFFDIEDVLGESKIDEKINTLKIDGNIINDEQYEKVYYDSYDDELYPLDNGDYSSYEASDIQEETNGDTAPNLFKDYNLKGFIDLFIYNFSIDFTCILGGLFLSIPSISITFINACQIGVLFSEVNFIIILLGVIPHGIFEIPSSVFAFSGALMLTSFELKILKGILSNKTTVKEQFNNSAYLVKDAIISAEIVFVLLLIAAFIETFITPVLLWLII
jgi:uncharacterized membrane protein SpoIIM required for sporulation